MQTSKKKQTGAKVAAVTTPVVTVVHPGDPSMPSLTPSPSPDGSGTSAPATTSSPVVLSTTPPVVNIPVAPVDATGIALITYRGYHPTAAVIAAFPDVVTELSSSTSYVSTMGPAAPAASAVVTNVTNASGWLAIRIALEAYLAYTKVQEGEAWKVVSGELDQLEAVFDVVSAPNPAISTQFPALARLFAARALRGQQAHATRQRKAAKAAKTAAAAQLATATTPSATTVPANLPAVSPTGGSQH